MGSGNWLLEIEAQDVVFYIKISNSIEDGVSNFKRISVTSRK